ncbi:hypothetical protein AUP68_13602 [Ilyonectria robusta]
MEYPVKEIPGVIRALAQGSPEQQAITLSDYFLPNASFSHPPCDTPSLARGSVPLAGGIDSLWVVLTIYRWYRTLSPHIDIKVDSAGTSDMLGVWSPVLMYSCSIRPTQRASLRITSADLCLVVYSYLQSAGPTRFSVATHSDYLPVTRRNQGWLFKKRYFSGTCKPSLE